MELVSLIGSGETHETDANHVSSYDHIWHAKMIRTDQRVCGIQMCSCLGIKVVYYHNWFFILSII